MKQIEYLISIVDLVKKHLSTEDTNTALAFIQNAVDERISFESQNPGSCVLCGEQSNLIENHCCSHCKTEAREMIKGLCPDCKGSGQDPLDKEACLSCNATGLQQGN